MDIKMIFDIANNLFLAGDFNQSAGMLKRVYSDCEEMEYKYKSCIILSKIYQDISEKLFMYWIEEAIKLDETSIEPYILLGRYKESILDIDSALQYYDIGVVRYAGINSESNDEHYNELIFRYTYLLLKNQKKYESAFGILRVWWSNHKKKDDEYYSANQNNYEWCQHILNRGYLENTSGNKNILMYLGVYHPGGFDECEKLDDLLLYGTERSYIDLARNLTNKNYNVFIACNISDVVRKEGIYFINQNKIIELTSSINFDYCITSRKFEDIYNSNWNSFINNDYCKRILWMHDNNTRDSQDALTIKNILNIDKIIVSSVSHKNLLSRYINLDHSMVKKLKVIPLGISDKNDILFRPDEYEETTKYRFIHYSSPDRSLSNVIELFNTIKNRCKNIYNIEVEMDVYLKNRDWVIGDNQKYIDLCDSTDGVNGLPILKRDELIPLLQKYDGAIYINKPKIGVDGVFHQPFIETFCLSVAEQQLAGIQNFNSDYYALGINTLEHPLNYKCDPLEDFNVVVENIIERILIYITSDRKSNKISISSQADSFFKNWNEISNRWIEIFDELD